MLISFDEVIHFENINCLPEWKHIAAKNENAEDKTEAKRN